MASADFRASFADLQRMKEERFALIPSLLRMKENRFMLPAPFVFVDQTVHSGQVCLAKLLLLPAPRINRSICHIEHDQKSSS